MSPISSGSAASTGTDAASTTTSSGGAGPGGGAQDATGGGAGGADCGEGGQLGGGGGGLPAQCADGFVSDGEVSLDCGGPCPPCGTKHLRTFCIASSECLSNLCELVPVALGGADVRECVGIPRASLVPLPNHPAKRVVAAVYDAVNGRVLLVGYDDDDDETSHVSELMNGSWGPLTNTAGALPPPTHFAGVAHDVQTPRTWIYGGTGSLDSVWQFDGDMDTWQVLPTSRNPLPYRKTGLGYDPGRDALVVYGGRSADAPVAAAAELPLTGLVWANLGGVPGQRAGHSLAYDHDSLSLLAVGGEVAGDCIETDATYGQSGSGWTRRAGNPFPGPRVEGHAIVDPLRERIVLLGGAVDGRGRQTDAWEWIAGRWVLTSATGGPSDRGGRAVYDPRERRIVYVSNYPNQEAHEYRVVGTPCDGAEDCPNVACRDAVCCEAAADCPETDTCASSRSPGICAPADP